MSFKNGFCILLGQFRARPIDSPNSFLQIRIINVTIDPKHYEIMGKTVMKYNSNLNLF